MWEKLNVPACAQCNSLAGTRHPPLSSFFFLTEGRKSRSPQHNGGYSIKLWLGKSHYPAQFHYTVWNTTRTTSIGVTAFAPLSHCPAGTGDDLKKLCPHPKGHGVLLTGSLYCMFVTFPLDKTIKHLSIVSSSSLARGGKVHLLNSNMQIYTLSFPNQDQRQVAFWIHLPITNN